MVGGLHTGLKSSSKQDLFQLPHKVDYSFCSLGGIVHTILATILWFVSLNNKEKITIIIQGAIKFSRTRQSVRITTSHEIT